MKLTARLTEAEAAIDNLNAKLNQVRGGGTHQRVRRSPLRCYICCAPHFHLSQGSCCAFLDLCRQLQPSQSGDEPHHFGHVPAVAVVIVFHQGLFVTPPLLPSPFFSSPRQDLSSFAPLPVPDSPFLLVLLSTHPVAQPGLWYTLGSPAVCKHSPSSPILAHLVDHPHSADPCFAPHEAELLLLLLFPSSPVEQALCPG